MCYYPSLNRSKLKPTPQASQYPRRLIYRLYNKKETQLRKSHLLGPRTKQAESRTIPPQTPELVLWYASSSLSTYPPSWKERAQLLCQESLEFFDLSFMRFSTRSCPWFPSPFESIPPESSSLLLCVLSPFCLPLLHITSSYRPSLPGRHHSFLPMFSQRPGSSSPGQR